MMMRVRTTGIVGAFALCISSAAFAAVSGVQWTPDAARILVNKDVGAERWAITLNLDDLTATGNVFFTDDRAPSFIWCEKTASEFDPQVGELTLQYRCLGSDRAVGGFALSDWSQISDQVFLPFSFFVPEAETCDLRDALNGPNFNNASSKWLCDGNDGRFEFQIFANGTGSSTATGDFDFDAVEQACTFARLGDGSFLDVEYSPSRDHLTVYEIPSDVKSVIVSECDRQDL
jgi:hypothetical protein